MPIPFSSPDGFFIKSIRFNNFCYIDKLVEGITLTPGTKKPYSPRIPNHKPYTVLGSGAHLRKNKPQRYTKAELEKKPWLSPHQSVSLIIRDQIELPAVKVNVGKNINAMAGIIIDPKDALINRCFLYDSDTYLRPYEFNTEQEALTYFNKCKDKTLIVSFEEFKKTLIKNKNATTQNEILARIRWNLDSSAIGIFNDDDESHYVAQFYAAKIKKALKLKAERLHESWDNSYHIPIYYYIPGNPKNYLEYTIEKINSDRAKANVLLHDLIAREKSFANEQFACLLLADDPQFALTMQWNNEPIILGLLRLGLFHIAQGMIENAGYTHIADYLKQNNLLTQAQKICTWNNSFTQQVILFNRIDLFDVILSIADPGTLNAINNEHNTALMLAAFKGHSDMVTKLLFAKADIDIKKPNGETALSMAGAHKSIICLLKFIQILIANNNLVNLELNETTLLELAIEKNEVEVVELLTKKNTTLLNKALYCSIDNKNSSLALKLIQQGADINAANSDNNFPLILAAAYGLKEVVDKLIAAKAHINCANKNMDTALILAALNGHLSVVDKLLAEGADVNATNHEHCTALMLTAFKGHIDIVIKLLYAKADIDIKKSNGETALFMASSHKPIVTLLTFIQTQKTNNNLVNSKLNETTLLELAIVKNEIEVVELLISTNTTLLTKALLVAIEKGNSSLALKFIAQGADVKATDSNSNTPLILSAVYGNKEILDKLITANAAVNYANKNKDTALILAVVNGRPIIVDKLLAGGAAVNLTNHEYSTALMYAASKGHTDIVIKLLSAQADIDIKKPNGKTALTMAKPHKPIVTLLTFIQTLKANNNLINRELNETTLLEFAIEKSDADIVEILIKNNSTLLNKALLIAIEKKNTLFALKFLEQGADANATNQNQDTALIVAIGTGQRSVVHKLLASGADYFCINKNKKSTLNLAIEEKQFHILFLLLNHIKKMSYRNPQNISQNIISWNNILSFNDEYQWQNKVLFTSLVDLRLASTQMSPELCDLIKKHAIACFNYLNTQPKNNRAISLRKIFLNRLLVEKFTEKMELEREIKAYFQGSGLYSQSCWGGGSIGKESRVAYAYNMGLFHSTQTPKTPKFEELPKEVRKDIIQNVSV